MRIHVCRDLWCISVTQMDISLSLSRYVYTAVHHCMCMCILSMNIHHVMFVPVCVL